MDYREFSLNESTATKEELQKIAPYLEVAQAALKAGKIKDIMDSPVTAPEGYDGDVYFTIEHNDGSFDMVQMDKDGTVSVEVDLEEKKGKGSAHENIKPEDLAKMLGVQTYEGKKLESDFSVKKSVDGFYNIVQDWSSTSIKGYKLLDAETLKKWTGSSKNEFETSAEALDALKKMLAKMHEEQPGYNPHPDDLKINVSESLMSEIDLIGQESETKSEFKRKVGEFLLKHAHDKSAAEEESLEALADTYFDEEGKKIKHEDFFESVDFKSMKDELSKIAAENNLELLQQTADRKQLEDRLAKDSKLPKEGVLAVDDFKEIQFIYVLSANKEKASAVNAAINKLAGFTGTMTVNNAKEGTVFLSVIVPNKK